MRTGTVSYKMEDLRKGVIIPIGMVGENDFTRVIFDSEEVFKKHPDAQVTMKVQPPKGGIYPAIVTRDENAVIWQVKAADVAHKGSGELQLTFTADTMVEKSYIAKTDIKRSLVGNGPAPDPVQDFVDNANEKLAEVDQALDDLAAMDNIAKTAEDSDIGKALSPKTVENGVVTEWEYITPGGGTEDYTDLENKPQIGGVELAGNKSLSDLGIAAADDVGKSKERDGIVQNEDTATQNITKDRYVIWKGDLYTASRNIASGETLSLLNLSPVPDGGFNALLGEIKQIGRIKAYKKYVQQEQSTGSVWIELDEPVDIEEGDEIEILVYQSDKETSGRSWSNTASWNGMAIQNKARNSIPLQDQPYFNSDRPAMLKIWKKNGYTKYVTITNNALTGFGVDFPDNLDSFLRVQLDPVSSQLKAGCTVEITVRKTI